MAAELTNTGTTTTEPWGASRLGHYTDSATYPAFTAVLDPETQTTVLIDESGRTVEMGQHGTSTNTTTTTSTSGDGSQPGASDSDSVPANDQD
ncbi:putative ATP-grasp target RiPP [Streptomyces sp. 3212.3]|uniref:putative ATP-grasp-modified RiPP n=1 Tax=Streptomyces sp. 3212.3 TaxID=1938846 RepID=UPI000E260861|nr:putative ATP-grasp-modified RiPP [Streptomyces sp. 3212.3]REE61433.1 putative ATP-grasp target RiPP [Streptomyces sp. 3212.3]